MNKQVKNQDFQQIPAHNLQITSGYKYSELGIIPDDWEISQLENKAEVIDPHPSHRAPAIDKTGIPFVGIGDLNEHGDIINNKVRLVPAHIYEEHVQRYKLDDNLIGLGRVASIGKVVKLKKTDQKYTISPTLGIIKPVEVNYDYLFYALNSDSVTIQFKRIMSGSTRSAVGMIVLRKLLIKVPPKNEQTVIAQTLSDIDSLINALGSLITKKRQIKQGVMQQLLTGKKRLLGFSSEWKSKKLGDIAEIIMGQSPSSAFYNTAGNGLPLIQGNADIKVRKTIKRVFTSVITKKCKAGDIIMTVRAPVGEIARATFNSCLGRGVCAIISKNDYLYHSLVFLESYWQAISKGSTFDAINSTDIVNVRVRLPISEIEQKAIAQTLNDMDSEIKILEQLLTKNKSLKQGMMQELLAGKTRLV